MPNLLTVDQTETILAYPLFHPRSRRAAPFTLSRDEFTREFPHESEHVEFKAGVGVQPLQATAVAFSNAAGGVVLVGVDDSGAPCGRPLEGGTADAIHAALSSAHDVGRYELHSLDVAGTAITVVAVARRQQGFAQTSSGRVLVRRGTSDAAIFGAELQRLINERSAIRFETTLTDQPVTVAAPAALARVIAAHAWPEEGPLAERLEQVGLARQGRLTVAGALHLLEDPAVALGKAYVEVLRYPDDRTPDYDRREEMRGPLDVQLDAVTRAVTDHLGTELVVLGIRRYDLPRIPEVVIRESVANALAHRSYEATGTAVRVELRPGSVRVTSPGSLPEPVTVANIREASAARNLDVIKVLRRYGLAEDAGRGVDVMQDTMRAEMLEPPEFADTGHSVEVTLPVRSAVAPVERAWVRELEGRGELVGADRLVLVHAARGETLTNARVRGIVQTDSQGAREVLRRLRDQGFLRQDGQRGGATYTLTGGLRPPAGLRLGPDELATLVERLADDGPIRNADVRQATGLDRVQSLVVLDRLVADGRLVRSGERRGTQYRRP
jgi:ATP-dependent DNA helicase RecG